MAELSQWYKSYINRIRIKNKRVWSNYLFMCDRNKDNEKALITFTTPKKEAYYKLLHIQEIKRYFSKLLSNLKIDIDKFAVIELGQSMNNPHLHVQLFYNDKDLKRIQKAYIKTLVKFNLHEKLCAFTTTDKTKTHIKYFSYILKEFGMQLSDNELMDLDMARKRLRVEENRNMQFISHSHNLLPHTVYKYLYHKKNINYSKADFFYHENYLNVKKSKNTKGFKIQWTIKPILEVLLYLFLPSENVQIRQKIEYNNKSNKKGAFSSFYMAFYTNYGFT
ncbi:hypothetical protein [Sulfurimonas sp.]|uniref:hypothetical protein n=1 Tax=Sulfurimonas sp. TaxID=2022749 RepID=UPI002AB1C2DA|nr:hypothetical protein [Sulfurimonas sp.]